MEILLKYFPELTSTQKEQFEQLGPLYKQWNDEINVISRKDMDHFYERHVLHSLAIGKFFNFQPNTKILDVGTGGGFPGIPLAILFPEVQFHLIDSIGKKIKVSQHVIDTLKLKNVTCEQVRAEQAEGKYDFVVSRAVTAMPKFMRWIKKKINREQQNEFNNGIIYLKGGDLSFEMATINNKYQIHEIQPTFEEEFFETKKIVHLEL